MMFLKNIWKQNTKQFPTLSKVIIVSLIFCSLGFAPGSSDPISQKLVTLEQQMGFAAMAKAADYEEELNWSKQETEILEGKTVEWDLEESLTETEELAAEELVPNWRILLTEDELDLLERCVMAEGGGESYECQVAIACVIINRVLDEKFPGSVRDVIAQKGQFSTWPHHVKRVTATNSVRQAVREALTETVIPEDVLYFRARYYHSWGTKYCRIDNTYFSKR